MSDASPAATAERAIAGAVVRHGLTIVGTYLAHRGWVDQDLATNAVAPIAEQIVGFGVAAGAASWAMLRARASHWRWVEAWTAPARPLPLTTAPTSASPIRSAFAWPLSLLGGGTRTAERDSYPSFIYGEPNMFGLHLLTTAKVAALAAAGHNVASAAASGLATAVAIAAQAGNPIGAAARVAIDDAEATGKPGAEKKADAVAVTGQVVVAEAARGGLTAVVTDAENFAGLVIEEILATEKTTPIGAIGSAILKLLGV